MIDLSASSVYYKPKVDRAEREKSDAYIRGEIEKIQSMLPQAGYRYVVQDFKSRGIKAGERKVRRVMREGGLQAKVKKAFVRTTDSNHNYNLYPNLIRGMQIDGSNQVWAADITYIRIENGFVFLAVILDLFSRKVIGWSISKNIKIPIVPKRDGPFNRSNITPIFATTCCLANSIYPQQLYKLLFSHYGITI